MLNSPRPSDSNSFSSCGSKKLKPRFVAGENASDLALVPLGQKFNAHSGIITDILFGSGYAGLGIKGGILLNAPSTEDNRATLDVGRRTVGPTIEIRLPARFSAALDAA